MEDDSSERILKRNYVSEQAWQSKTFGQFALHKLCYAAVRAEFGLGADATVRVFAKVADAYKLDKRTQRTFEPRAAFPSTLGIPYLSAVAEMCAKNTTCISQ